MQNGWYCQRQTSLGKRVEIQPHSAVREDSDFESAEVSLEKCAARRDSKCLQGFETSTKYSLLHAVLIYCCDPAVTGSIGVVYWKRTQYMTYMHQCAKSRVLSNVQSTQKSPVFGRETGDVESVKWRAQHLNLAGNFQACGVWTWTAAVCWFSCIA